MKLLLTLIERFGITRFLSEAYQKGGMDFSTLVDGNEIQKKIALDGSLTSSTDDKKKTENWIQSGDFKKYDIKVNFTPEGGSQYIWDVEKDKGEDIEFTDREADVMKKLIEDKSKAKTLSMSDGFVVALAPKLGLKL
jgi:hypothetical protein